MVTNSIKRHIAHLGAIIFNYSMVGFAIVVLLAIGVVAYPLLSMFSLFALIMYYFALVVGAVFTVGLVLITPEYRALFSGPVAQFLLSVGESSQVVVPKILDLIPIVGVITAILIVISMVFLLADSKWEKSKSRFITLAIILVILIIIVILAAFGVLAIVGGALLNESH